MTAAVPQHRIVRCIAGLKRALDEVSDAQAIYLTTSEKAQTLRDLARLESRVASLKLRLLACADDVADQAGARDAGAWLAHEARLDRGAARRDSELATAMEDRWHHLQAALGTGALNVAQARVCVQVLSELPEDLDATLVDAVEEQLVILAEQWAPKDLKVLGRKILEAIDPETADAHEARKLQDEERRARERTSLHAKRLGDGVTRISANLPDAVANRLLTYLDAFTNPRHQTQDGLEPPVSSTESRGPAHVQRGHAFAALLEHLDPDKLPAHGGDATTMIITISLEELRAKLAAADLIGHDLDRVSATEARRLACNAELIPAVLGTNGEVLDLGRGNRLFNRAQRKALRLRDRRCRAEGCDTPAAWTEAHHKSAWAKGGPTDLANAISLCSFHHHRCHDDHYHHEYLPNGDVRYRRRT
jgi:hypothetical protein